MSKTNPIGTGKVNVSTTVPAWLDNEIKALAMQTGISRNKYIRALIEDAARHHIQVTESTLTSFEIRNRFQCEHCGTEHNTADQARDCCKPGCKKKI